MYRQGIPANPYGHNAPFNPLDQQFRSPRPRYQSSPRNQQFGQNRPMRSPNPNFHPSPGGRMNFSPYHNRSFSPKTTPPYGERGTPYNRGYFNDHRGRGGRGRFSPGQGTPRSDSSDQNPGGNDDISLYYKHSMVEDPWRQLQPVPVSVPQNSSATT